jgi:hypothetical protein
MSHCRDETLSRLFLVDNQCFDAGARCHSRMARGAMLADNNGTLSNCPERVSGHSVGDDMTDITNYHNRQSGGRFKF